MRTDWSTITIAICLAAWFIARNVILPMFNAYLEYRLNCKQMEDMPNEPIPQLYRERRNEEGLQRDIDSPDIEQRSGKSDDRTPLYDEELPS